MFKVYFGLRKNKIDKQGTHPLGCTSISIPQNRLKKCPMGQSTSWWLGRTRALPNRKNKPYNYHVEYNIILNEQKSKVNEIYRHSIISGDTLSMEYFMSRLAADIGPTDVNDLDIWVHGGIFGFT